MAHTAVVSINCRRDATIARKAEGELQSRSPVQIVREEAQENPHIKAPALPKSRICSVILDWHQRVESKLIFTLSQKSEPRIAIKSTPWTCVLSRVQFKKNNERSTQGERDPSRSRCQTVFESNATDEFTAAADDRRPVRKVTKRWRAI